MINKNFDLFREIALLKTQRNAVVLAHYYQNADIQDVADFVGDSLELAKKAASTTADLIVFAGVHFMAETAKILNPAKKVVLPDLSAGCSLAESCPAPQFSRFIDRHPGAAVVSYINCSAETKALSDYICTSSNAERVIRAIPEGRPVVFAPDRNLGRYLEKKLGRKLIIWEGACIVHETFSEKKLVELKIRHPEAKIIAHPECEEHILRLADHIGSTSSLLKFTQIDSCRQFIVVTEEGILHQMRRASPEKTFIPAPSIDESCSCNQCPFMKKNTLEKVYLCLRDEKPEITLDENLRIAALKPLQRMMELG